VTKSRIPRSRVLALDPGTKRIGVAVSDELRLTAHGLENIDVRSSLETLEVLKELVRAYNVSEVVVGLPVNMNGTSGAAAEGAVSFARLLREVLPVEVHLLDERLTSAQAEKTLLEANVSRKKRKGLRDRLAAVLILQSFLDGRNRGD